MQKLVSSDIIDVLQNTLKVMNYFNYSGLQRLSLKVDSL